MEPDAYSSVSNNLNGNQSEHFKSTSNELNYSDSSPPTYSESLFSGNIYNGISSNADRISTSQDISFSTRLPRSDFTSKPSLFSFDNEKTLSTINNDLTSSSVLESTSIATKAEASSTVIPSIAVGSAISTANSAITDYNNKSDIMIARQGNGPNGHAFDANQHAENQANYNSLNSTIQGALITAGSAFGPEGLAVGAGLAAAESGISSQFSPSQNTTQSTGGNLVNASDVSS